MSLPPLAAGLGRTAVGEGFGALGEIPLGQGAGDVVLGELRGPLLVEGG